MNRKWWLGALAAGALLTTCLPCAAQPRGQGQPRVSSQTVMGTMGSITVSVRDEQGKSLSLLPVSVSIAAGGSDVPLMGAPSQKEGEEWVFTNLVAGEQYVVKVEAQGFTTAQQFVELPDVNGASVRVNFYLVPADQPNRFARPAGGAILAPRAQKEVQEGIKDLAANKIESAQKHLAKALKMAPGNPLVNYLMGESWLRAGKLEEATKYLENAVSLDPKQTQALLALGRLRYQQGDMAKAIEWLKQAVGSAPESWQAHWLLAAAYLRTRNYEQARDQAGFALKYGKEQADPARLILGVALAKLGERDKAIERFSDYLKRHPDDPRAEQIRGLIAELRQPRRAALAAAAAPGEQPQGGVRPIATKTDAPAGHSPEPTRTADLTATPTVAATALTPPLLATVPAKESWEPADVDAEKPERISGAACQLPQILRQAARHAEELVSDLEKFSATEDFQEVEIRRNGGLRRPMAQKFSYLVFIEHIRPHLFSVDEMRGPADRLAGEPLFSTGTAALALAFHPDFASDFAWKCEGMGEWKGQPAWLIHFQQRADRPTSRLHGFKSGSGGGYSLALKGRAWVAANGNQVLHLETDLVRPQKQARLEREHFSINYALVTFRTHPAALWLPESVDAYFRYGGHLYHQYSRFSNFELFWVGTVEKISQPKAAKETREQ